jgi:hypothetical protein
MNCPFCHCKLEVCNLDAGYQVTCDSCGFSGPIKKSEEGAIARVSELLNVHHQHKYLVHAIRFNDPSDLDEHDEIEGHLADMINAQYKQDAIVVEETA